MIKYLQLLVVTYILVLNSSAQSATWECIYTDDTGSRYYINKDSVYLDYHRNDEIMYHAIFKCNYTDEGRRQLSETFRRNNGYIFSRHNEVSYSIFLEYFKVNKKAYFAIDSEVVFAFDGSIIEDVSYERYYHKWKSMVPGQISFDLAELTFNYLHRKV